MANKEYIDVLVLIDKNGKKRPLGLVWKDGRRFLIGRILDISPAASLKAGGAGIRYTCEVNGKATFLFDEEGRWFVEGRGS